MENKKERKHFKFYKSYYDMFCELKTDKEKLSYIDAIFKKQFFNIDPELTGMSNFAYISQKHNIDNQIQGFIDMGGVFATPYKGSIQGPLYTPCIEHTTDNIQHTTNNKEDLFSYFWSLYPLKVGKKEAGKIYEKLYGEHEEIIAGLKRYIEYWARRGSGEFIPSTPHATTFLNQRRWEDEIAEPSIKKGGAFSIFNI